MRVERQAGLHVDAKTTAAPSASWTTASAQRSFENVLRDQRQRVTSNSKHPQQSQKPTASRPRATETVERNERERAPARGANERASMTVERSSSPVCAPVAEESPTTTFMDRSLAARWRRAINHQGATCIEVVHAASGSRFLLSRGDGVWLLSIQSTSTSSHDDAFVAELRALFAERGLGPVDVVKV